MTKETQKSCKEASMGLVGSWVILFKETYRIQPEYKNFSRKETFLIFISNPKFLAEVDSFRKLFEINLNGFSENVAREWMRKFNTKDYARYDLAITDILKKFKIHPRWRPAIEYFLIFGKNDIDHILPPKVDYRLEEDKSLGIFRLILEIFPDTKPKDIQQEWPSIE